MTLIHVPKPLRKPPQSALDLDRPISSLLKAQIEHLYEAEKRLPLRYHSNIYVNAIKTEQEAARYVRAVTEAIRAAHADSAAATRQLRDKRGLQIAAVADERGTRKRTVTVKRKRKSAKATRRT